MGIEAVREICREGTEPHLIERMKDILIGNRFAERNVIPQRHGEKLIILKHRREQGVVFIIVQIPDIRAADENMTLRRIVEAEQELNERGLAGTVFSDDGKFFARFKNEVDVSERPVICAGIAEANVLEFDPEVPGGNRPAAGAQSFGNVEKFIQMIVIQVVCADFDEAVHDLTERARKGGGCARVHGKVADTDDAAEGLPDEIGIGKALLNKGEEVEVVGKYAHYFVISAEPYDLLVDEYYVRLETEEAFESWTGYARSKSPVFSSVYMREEPIAHLGLNTKLTVLEGKGNWLFVQWDEGEGYMLAEDVSKTRIRYGGGGGGGGGGGAVDGTDVDVSALSATGLQGGMSRWAIITAPK